MRVEDVALIPTCAECGERWLPADDSRWRLYLGVDEDLEEQPELVWICPACGDFEFGRNASIDAISPEYPDRFAWLILRQRAERGVKRPTSASVGSHSL